MGTFEGMSEISEADEKKGGEVQTLSQGALDKFDRIFGDDKMKEKKPSDGEILNLSLAERESKFDRMFEEGGLWTEPETEILSGDLEESGETSETLETEDEAQQEPDFSAKREPNSKYEFHGNTYETDDKGQTYKKNGELLSDCEYTVNGNTYKTDERGRIISCDSVPELKEDGSRNMKDQREAGGDERREDDEGSHIIARILGGAEGDENLVPMRRTINRGDYKKMENEIAKALQDGKDVRQHIDLEYDGDSERPSRIHAEYTIDGRKTEVEFDNREDSTELMDSLKDKIGPEDYQGLKDKIEDGKDNGEEITVTSVKTEYDENGNMGKVTIGILNESTGIKSYKFFE